MFVVAGYALCVELPFSYSRVPFGINACGLSVLTTLPHTSAMFLFSWLCGVLPGRFVLFSKVACV